MSDSCLFIFHFILYQLYIYIYILFYFILQQYEKKKMIDYNWKNLLFYIVKSNAKDKLNDTIYATTYYSI